VAVGGAFVGVAVGGTFVGVAVGLAVGLAQLSRLLSTFCFETVRVPPAQLMVTESPFARFTGARFTPAALAATPIPTNTKPNTVSIASISLFLIIKTPQSLSITNQEKWGLIKTVLTWNPRKRLCSSPNFSQLLIAKIAQEKLKDLISNQVCVRPFILFCQPEQKLIHEQPSRNFAKGKSPFWGK
jgi:hypothetical protein